MRTPQKYRQTEIGSIPEDWEVRKLGQIGESIIGLTYSPKDVKSYGTLVLRSSNVQNGKLAFDDNVFVNMELPQRVIVKENDILICVRNGSRQLIGKCALIDKKTSGSAFGAFMSIYRSEFSELIFHQFQSFLILKQIHGTLGATINQITNKDLALFQIPLPPTKAEQTAIANALNDADALITQLEKLIAKKRLIKQGAMQELLKPKEGWVEKKLGEICQIFGRIGFRGYTVNDIVAKEQGAITISPSNIQGDKMDFAKCTYLSWKKYEESPEIKVFNGDILLVKTGSTAGKTALVKQLKEKATVNPQIVVLKRIIVDNTFLSYVMSYKIVQNQIISTIVGGAIPTLSQKQVAGFKITIPESKEEQIRIAQTLSDMDAEIEGLERKLEKYRKIKEGMMQNLLTGKIRLI